MAAQTTATQYLGAVVLLSVLAGLVGFLVKRSRARSLQKRRDLDEVISELPEEYRPIRLRHRTLWLVLYGLNCGVVGLLERVVSGDVALAYALVVFTPFAVMLTRQASVRHRQIRESVHARAAQMDYRQLGRLINALETVYGATMKPLRTLLPASPQD